jgi:glyoxylase-like metal-dependent hydrolase (beta-lactamase superfamily II)
MVLLSGIFFGPGLGFMAGGIGSALADIFGGYYQWAPWTLFIKGIEASIMGLSVKHLKINTHKVSLLCRCVPHPLERMDGVRILCDRGLHVRPEGSVGRGSGKPPPGWRQCDPGDAAAPALFKDHKPDKALRVPEGAMLRVEQIPTEGFSLLSYIVYDEASREGIIIDPPLYIAHQADLASLHIRAVINTHTHPDHTMGNRSLSGLAPVLAHEAEDTWYLRLYNTLLTAVFTGRLQTGISYTLNEKERDCPGGHSRGGAPYARTSPGSICLYWSGNLVSGDTVFAEGFGRTDLPGGSMEQLRKSIGRIMCLPPDTTIWPGHSYGNDARPPWGRSCLFCPLLQAACDMGMGKTSGRIEASRG